MRKFWADHDLELLLSNYPDAETNQLKALLQGRSWTAIKLQAQKFGLRRHNVGDRLGNLRKLTEGTPEAWYWIGLLWADGCLKDSKRLILSLKDKDHVEKYGEFIEFSGKMQCREIRGFRQVASYWRIAVSDFIVGKILEKDFGLSARKTYNPPKIPAGLTNDQLDALIIGFIDGDGCIKSRTPTNTAIAIKCHSNWLANLNFFADRVYQIAGEPDVYPAKINSCGYAEICFGKFSVCRALKKRALELSLPIMERKWGKIDETLFSRHERAMQNLIRFS